MFWAKRQHELLNHEAEVEIKRTALKYDLERRENELLAAVINEKQDGKPRFSNEQARKSELLHRIDEDSEYQRKMADLNALTSESMHLAKEAKYAGKIVEIMCTFASKEEEPLIPVPASVLAKLGRPDIPKEAAVKVSDFERSNPFADDDDDVAA
jgi:hypothetical protein